jgi:GT2 family glycosyltransferase
LLNCLRSIEEQLEQPKEVIVVDNASHDRSVEAASRQFPEAIVIHNSQNLGPGRGCNVGAQRATGDFLFFINPDVILAPACLGSIAATLNQSPGVAGPVVTVEASGGTRDFGSTIDIIGHPLGLKSPGNPLFFSGAALATNRTIFQRLGGFDHRFFWGAEDIDYCWRVLLSGAEVRLAEDAHLSHRGGAATPGGYVRSGRLETTRMRLHWREQNTLATMLKCAPAGWLPLVIAAFLLKTTAYASGALLLRQPGLARDLFGGLYWNAKQFRETYRLRRNVPRTRVGQKRASSRISRRLIPVDLIRKHGVPRIVASGQ